MLKHLPAWLSLFFACTALGGTATGKVAAITVSNISPAVLFALDNDSKGAPRCNESGRFAIDTGKFGGPSSLQALLEAKRENYTVSVQGLNTCVADWKAEDVKTLRLH